MAQPILRQTIGLLAVAATTVSALVGGIESAEAVEPPFPISTSQDAELIADTWISSATPTVGHPADARLDVSRTTTTSTAALLAFAIPAAPATKYVRTASLRLRDWAGYNCPEQVKVKTNEAGWNPSSVTWRTAPASVATKPRPADVSGGAAPCGRTDTVEVFDVTYAVRSWTAGGANYGFRVEMATTGKRGYGAKEGAAISAPSLALTWGSYPDAPAAIDVSAPRSTEGLLTTTPRLQTQVTTTDASPLKAVLEVSDSAGSLVWRGYSERGRSGNVLGADVPPGLLGEGTSYSVKAWAVDIEGIQSRQPAVGSFTVAPRVEPSCQTNCAPGQRVVPADQEEEFVQRAVAFGVPESVARQAIFNSELANMMPFSMERETDSDVAYAAGDPGVDAASPEVDQSVVPPAPKDTAYGVAAEPGNAESGVCGSGRRLFRGSEVRKIKSWLGQYLYWVKLKKRWCTSVADGRIASVWASQSADVYPAADSFYTDNGTLTDRNRDVFLRADGVHARSGHLTKRVRQFRYCTVAGLPFWYNVEYEQGFNAFWDGTRISWTRPI